MSPIFSSLRASQRLGTVDPVTKKRIQTPWIARTEDDIYIGLDGSVWVYRCLPVFPIALEDENQQLMYGSTLRVLLIEIGKLAKKPLIGTKEIQFGGSKREIHIETITWAGALRVPPDITPALRLMQTAMYRNWSSWDRACFVGIKLEPSIDIKLEAGTGIKGTIDMVRKRILIGLGASTVDLQDVEVYLEGFAKDMSTVLPILKRAGTRRMTEIERLQLQYWWAGGTRRRPEINEYRDHLEVFLSEKIGAEQIEFAGLTAFNNPMMTAPGYSWAHTALEASECPAILVSIRGLLEPLSQTHKKLRSQERKQVADILDIEEATPISDIEESARLQTIQEAENYFVSIREPFLTDTDIIFARKAIPANETYADILLDRMNIEVTPKTYEHMYALESTMPTSPIRLDPIHTISPSVVAYAGMPVFSSLGEENAPLHLGITLESNAPVRLDPEGACKIHAPGSMGIFGDSGSGKTTAGLNLCVQGVKQQTPCWFVNPKGEKSLSGVANLVPSDIISISPDSIDTEELLGYFDSFNFLAPGEAAEFLSDFLLSIMNWPQTDQGQDAELSVQVALSKAAKAGIRCGWDAINQFLDNEWARNQILKQYEGNSLTRLAISTKPRRILMEDKKLTLVEFMYSLPPVASDASAFELLMKNRQNRLLISLINLVTQIGIKSLVDAGKGIFVLDEAWVFMGTQVGRSFIDRIARMSRTWNVLPIFCTQQIGDIMDSLNFESLLSRVLCMEHHATHDGIVALQLAGLHPEDENDHRVQFLTDCRAKKMEDGEVRAAMGIYKDLKNRHDYIAIAPLDNEFLDAL